MHATIRRINHMPIQIQEPVKASLVILNVGFLGPALNNLILGLDQESTGNVMIGPLVNGAQRLSIEQERISINLQQDRVSVDKDYPADEHDLDRLAEIAELVISNINVHLTVNLTDVAPPEVPGMFIEDAPPEQREYTFGFNLQAACRYSSVVQPNAFPIDRYLNVDELRNLGCDGFDGNWELAFVSDERTWKLGVKPFPGVHDGTLVLVSVNSHFEDQSLPRTSQAISDTFRDVWNGATKFVNSVEVQK